jgi:TonB-linked SusC/RagA family outer membrane protein
MRKSMLLGICAILIAIGAFAQTTPVTGKVIDDKGAPVSGASVLEKGTKNGTTTAADGSFSLKVKPGSTLVVSGVGFENKQISASSSNLMVELSTDVRSLSEVVVTGTGVATSKRKLGFNVESVTSGKLPVIPSATLDQALVGKIAGAQISSVSGNPGDPVNIVLRGINTVDQSTRPLIMMDGVEIPFGNLNSLDLSLVERVEVVKGAASATLYGAQGANGVIQIFTKKGVKGKMTINASVSGTSSSFINAGNFGKASLHPYLTDASGNIISATTQAGFTAGQALFIDPVYGDLPGSATIAYKYGTNIPGLPSVTPGATQNYTRYGILDPRNNANQPYVGKLKYNDHFKQVFQGNESTNYSINMSGGAEKSDFNISLANNKTTSPFLKNNGALDRTNLTANLGFEVFKNFTIRSITGLIYQKNNMHPGLGAPGGGGNGLGFSSAGVGTVFGFLNTSPFFSLTDTIVGGNYPTYQRASFASVNAGNPFYNLQYTSGDSKRYDIMQIFDANYKVNKFLTLNAKYAYNYKNGNDIWTYYNQSLNENSNGYGTWAYYYNETDNTGEVVNFQYSNTQQNFLASAFIVTDFEKDFKLKLPIQTTTQIAFDYRRRDYNSATFGGQSLSVNPPYTLSATARDKNVFDYRETFVTYGYLVDQKFEFGNYGGVTAGFRTDYSSAFGAGSSPFTFPHYNGYLNLSAFKFLDNISNTLSSFKIRAAYGKAGIQPKPFDRYPVLNQQPTGNELTYTNQTTAKNPNLNVELTAETEVGTDVSINLGKGDWFKSLNFSFTYWKRKTDNAIFSVNVPPSTGANSILTNAIGMSSNGYDISVNIPILSKKDFTWDLTANFGHQTSNIDFVQGGDIPLTTNAGSTGLVLTAGRKIGEIYGYKALTSVGQLRADGKTPFISSANQGGYEIVEGRVVNKTTKAIFFSDEAESLGDPNPALTSSFINTFSWKGIVSFGFQFDWISGAHLYNQTKEWMYRDGISSDFAKPVTINGQTGAWSAYYASAYYALGETARGVGNNVTKDYFYSDASFVRLRNVSIGIDFARFANKPWLKKCQLVLSGRNLLTFTKYDGMDPEISSGSSNSAWDRGIDHSTIPNMKSYQATLNLSF